MVKESKKEFPHTNGWEFFALTVSANGTKIASRGDSASNTTGSCLGCHEPAAKFDYICKKTTVARVSRSRMSESPRCKTTTLAARSDTLEEKLLLKYETNS